MTNSVNRQDDPNLALSIPGTVSCKNIFSESCIINPPSWSIDT